MARWPRKRPTAGPVLGAKIMAQNNSHGSSSGPPRRRLILVALHWENEARMRGIVDYAHARGWHLLNLRSFQMRVLRNTHPDGVLWGLPEEKARLAKQLVSLGAPAVHIQSQDVPIRCPIIAKDYVAIGRVAAEHFAERGFRRVAYLRSERWGSSVAKRICESFIDHARRLKMNAHVFALQDPAEIFYWARVSVFAKRLKKELAGIELPLGIFAYHDLMASRLCYFCKAAGLRVPEQVAVLGQDNQRIHCDCAMVPLSSVDTNEYEHGRAAAELLEKLMDGEKAPAKPILVPPTGVVTRMSTDVLAVPDLDTARAIRYIWEHLAEPLTVARVAEAVGVSRRTLDRNFRLHLGKSVNEELNRKRVERACKLLTGTQESAMSIARQVGFRNEPYMFHVFRKQMGTTPRQYRLTSRAKSAEAKDAQADNRQ
jgi:LacI family transcriptional regulator